MKWTQTKTRRGLTPPARGLLALAALLLAAGVFSGLYPFLAQHEPAGAPLLVVEGWANDEELRQAVAVFESGGYRRIAVTGCEADFAADLLPLRSYAKITHRRLVQLGVPEAQVFSVSAGRVRRDRTYHSARALQQALNGGVPALDLFSVGPHCRRSRLLFRKVFGPEVQVGVICGTPSEYAPSEWWRCSDGVRQVLGEALAWGYARFLFFPDAPADPAPADHD